MGYVSEFVRMIFIIFIFFFMPLSLQRTHIWSVDALWNAEETFPNFHVHGLSEMYSTEENVRENEKRIEKISGQDETEEKEPLIVTKLRALLGLGSSIHKRPFNGDSEHVSPSPSPLPSREAEPPAPPPLSVLHVHAHPRHHRRQNPPSHGIQNEDRDRAKTILRAVLASVGVAAVFSVLGLIWVFSRKFRNHNNKAKRTPPPDSEKKSSASKVSMNSGIDLFYLNSLGDDIEQHSLKQTFEAMNVNTTSNPSSHRSGAIYESEEPKQEVISSEYDNASSSISTKEIVSVQEDTKSVNYDRESECEPGGEKSSSGDEIIPLEFNSSDNESFHSFVDSHSSNVRISNASAAGCRSETSSQRELSLDNSTDAKTPLKSSLPSSSQNSISHKENPKHEEEKSENSLRCPQNFTRPLPTPPPPPPPPPVQMPLFKLHSVSYSSEISSLSPCSSKLHNLTSPRFSNQSRESKMLSPSQPSPSKSYPSIPPPPPFEGNYNNVKTPPPPPSQHPQFTPLGKDGAPLPKLKPLHWDKVRAAPNRTMVWDKLRSSSFELDEEMIESLFGYNLQNSIGNDETKSKSPSPSKHILEPKRFQNITILSKALNVTSEQVCDALIQGKGLYLQQLEALVKMVPTKEEAAKLLSYKGDINELGSAERFVRAMLSVPLAFQRVEAMLYRETFEDEVVHLRNSFSMLEEACKELRSSRLFLKLLEAVLKTGNRMNVGTIRGGARAFKLDALLKLADVKGTDGKTTLLHFVVQEIVRSEGIRASDSIMGKINQKSKHRTEEEKEEDYRKMGLELVSGLSTELFNVKKTATIDMDVLASSVSNLSDGMAKLQHLIYKELSLDEKSENFVNSMKSFIKYADKCLKDLQEDEDRVLALVKEITEYFHGDVSKEDANLLRIFVIVRDFLGMLDNVCKELRRSKASRSPNPLAPFR